MLIYVTCPGTADGSGLNLGFNIISEALGQLFIDQKRAFPLNYPSAFPAMGYCSPGTDEEPPPPAPPPPAPPPPAPAPTQTIRVGPEDTITKIDVDGDGRPDVLVVVDRPPQNP